MTSMEADLIPVIRDLQVYRGASPILQGVPLQVRATPLALVGGTTWGSQHCARSSWACCRCKGGHSTLWPRNRRLRPFCVARAGIGYATGALASSRPSRCMSICAWWRRRPVARLAGGRTHIRRPSRARPGVVATGCGALRWRTQMLAVAGALLMHKNLLVMPICNNAISEPA